MMRSSIERVTFRYDFLLEGVDTAQPSGAYEIETDDEPLLERSFMAPTSGQTCLIPPHDLEMALARDSRPEAASCA